MEIKLDPAKKLGAFKPVNGVGNGPVTGSFTSDKRKEFQDAGIPYSRTHDTEGTFGSGEFINIHCIFPNFDADVNDPASYNFACTDLYIQYILDAGTKVFYRLGETIENRSYLVNRYAHPPKDYLKWAQICEHIILHYNEGWANGFHHGIEFWEIWNEPEGSGNWEGTPEEFFKFYRIAANYLKEKFPNIKIGGYGSIGFRGTMLENPQPDWWRNVSKFAEDFMKYITAPETKAPLDFFSWHCYATMPAEVTYHAYFARNLLDRYGLRDTLSVMDEWNWRNPAGIMLGGRERKLAPIASMVAQCLTRLQKDPVDMAMYYDAEARRIHFCGFFDEYTGEPEKTYYAFKAFWQVAKNGVQIDTGMRDDCNITSLASAGDNCVRLMLANYLGNTQEINIDATQIPFGEMAEVFRLDDRNDLSMSNVIPLSDRKFTVTLETNTLLLIEIR